ncbi:MAG: trehalose-phosphatase [Gammaproteobacteria bacterium]
MNTDKFSNTIPAPPPLRELIGNANDWALFLDFDGTLLDLAERPDAIRVPADLPRLLHDLAQRFGGAVAILTGRALANLDRHLPEPELAAAGQHGAEWRLAGQGAIAEVDRQALAGPRAEIKRFSATHPTVLVEDKGASIALHYRAAPEARAEVDALAETLVGASGGALEAISGKLLCELRPAGANKGRALRNFLAQAPFAGRRPLVLGDDVTDEAAFAAALVLGGSAIKVGEGESRAPWRLHDPKAAHAWLAAALAPY